MESTPRSPSSGPAASTSGAASASHDAAAHPSGPAASYRALAERHAALRDRAKKDSAVLATTRGVVFVAAAACLVLVDPLEGGPARAAMAVAAVLALAFLVLVGRHRRVRERERRHEALRSLAGEGLLRLARDWDGLAAALPEGEGLPEPPPPDHPYAGDLHVEGMASLRRLAGPVTSESGRRSLRKWLLEPADPATVGLRQEAVAELARDPEFRMELTVRGRLAGEAPRGALDELLIWARSEPVLLEDGLARLGAWILPLLTMGLLTLQILGALPALWIVPFVVQLLVLRRAGRRLGGDLHHAARGAPALRSHGPQLRLVEEAAREAELLRELARRLDVSDEPAHVRLDRLGRLADVAESRHNLFYQALNPVLLLDVHLGLALDRWRRRSGSHVERWLGALGEVEALGALACLAHDHPDWAFPTWSDASEEPVLRARALGHPLLPPDACVRNDVEVGPPGTFLLITGSNMSGKSTLLRAIGTDVVLAGAGAPVCADALDLPPVRLHTSMLVVDSLEEGVSRFMAELLRVRAIVTAARMEGPGMPPVLYLLDEVLQGTNTAERRVAARAILRHLLDAGALGVVTTHDLTLHEAPDLVERARARHFRESVEQAEGGTSLTFDYLLRPGLATTRNALKLLEAVGLGGEAVDAADAAGATEVSDEGEGPGA